MVRFVARKELSKVLGTANGKKTYVYRIAPRVSFRVQPKVNPRIKFDQGGNLSVREESAETHTPDSSLHVRVGNKRWAGLRGIGELSAGSLDSKQVNGAVYKGHDNAQLTPEQKFSPKVVVEEGIDVVVEAGVPSDSAGKSQDHDKLEEDAGAMSGDHDDADETQAEESSIKVTTEEDIHVVVEGRVPSGYSANGESSDNDMPTELIQSYLRFKTAMSEVQSVKGPKDALPDLKF